MKNILFIHQSAELYGSDKTLLIFLQNINKNNFFTVVVLPNEGPLKAELEKIISEENLKPEETITFINNSFKNGEIQAAGTAFASILPPVSRFSPTRERAIKKETVLEKLKSYFDRFFDISGGEL